MAVAKVFSKLSPFQRVIAALILGIMTGIIVGEPAGHREILGNGLQAIWKFWEMATSDCYR